MGICGTGAISGVAELWRKKIIEPGGAFITDSTIKPLQMDAENRPQYTLVAANTASNIDSIFINQKDIRSIQLGKAALMTGIECILRAAGYHQPQKIIIAGAFGNHIDKEDMMIIGMLPEIDPGRIEIAGNSAGAGAVMVLCEEDYFNKSIEMTEKITTIELATEVGFQELFVKHLSFSNV